MEIITRHRDTKYEYFFVLFKRIIQTKKEDHNNSNEFVRRIVSFFFIPIRWR